MFWSCNKYMNANELHENQFSSLTDGICVRSKCCPRWLHGAEWLDLTMCPVPNFVANLDCLISKYGVSLNWVSVPNLLCSGRWVSFPLGGGGGWIKQPWYETDHLYPRTVQIKGCLELYCHRSLISHLGAVWETVGCVDHGWVQNIWKICLLQTAVHLYKVWLFESLKYVVLTCRV